ncbi:MAG TPA: TlyA family RNA methyltransferase [Candidatus Paceibacterota bacterium]|nr:TlyA family RNA methyltransferase [Verrucomicrobiota bacterium]HRY50229.1 TlyA family RNA methyltransferase [Candidatus Paceibacterota bacterium]HRZ99362.1 TlyA family RNA methyltransferase [Candidatus Paceibacterota bacterium]
MTEALPSAPRARFDRLDRALVERGLCPSREQAQRAIMAGRVRINEQRARKPSDRVRENDCLQMTAPERYVSRGGIKLEHALRAFGVPVNGCTAIDVGASTGGFTDCLLQHGVRRVFAVDVGTGQLAWKLRQDARVTVMERINARHLAPTHFPQPFIPFDLAVMDCSFISLQKIIPPVVSLVRPGGTLIALVKPQFEAGKAEVDKGAGVIVDPRVHRRVLEELSAFVGALPGLCWRGDVESPVLGPAGNKEFLVHLEKES